MMQAVENKILELVNDINFKEVSQLFSSLQGGKRLRAKLVMKIADGHKDATLLAAVIELIHAASLLHDDVIDEALVRRGVASVNATEGSKTAVMLGDVLYSKGFSSLVRLGEDISHCVANSVTQLSVGEMKDVMLAAHFNSDEKIYLDMLYLKTATLIEATARSAALLADKDAEKYALYGRNLGLSFQIIDDILDIVSDAKTLGKPSLNDFVEGKCTLPYIYLYHDLDDTGQERLVSYHGKILTQEESAWILSEMKTHQSVERSYALARKLSNEAIAAVDDVSLHAVIETMMERRF